MSLQAALTSNEALQARRARRSMRHGRTISSRAGGDTTDPHGRLTLVRRRIEQLINRATSTIQRHQDVGFAPRQVQKGRSWPRSRLSPCCAADLDTCSA
jgi:hypothetical protein